MTIDDVLAHYPSQIAAAKAIGISKSLMSKLYVQRNRPSFEIPIKYQIDWELATDGKLRAGIDAKLRSLT